jgi:hypothetical protein
LENLKMIVRTGIEAGSGLGDAVADLAHLTGLDRVAKFYEQVTGKDCGCEARRETLNALVPLGGSQA